MNVSFTGDPFHLKLDMKDCLQLKICKYIQGKESTSEVKVMKKGIVHGNNAVIGLKIS